jgi:hypothetical protein
MKESSRPDVNTEPEYQMTLPEAVTYADLNCKSVDFQFNLSRIEEYLKLFNKAWEEKYRLMYEQRYCGFNIICFCL